MVCIHPILLLYPVANLKGKISNSKAGLERRRQLRNALAPAEAALWILLKGKALDGIKFRRQHGVGPYVLDFYCPEHRICIEMDGAPHFTAEGTKADERRDEYLESLGIQVLRFENHTVFYDPNWIVQAILYAVRVRSED